jgi:hypothetical protein
MTTPLTTLPDSGTNELYSQIERPSEAEASADFDALISIAKDHGLPNSDVLALLDLGSRCAHRGAAAALARQQSDWQKTREAWVLDLKTDPDIGVENFDASHALALLTVETFGGPGLSTIFNAGLGDHPAMFKFCLAVGKKLTSSPETSRHV